jgi:hypothetical protein
MTCFLVIRCSPLYVTDVYGGAKLRFSVATLFFAWSGADSPQNPGENVGYPVQLVRTAVAFLKKTSDVSGDVGVGRTSALARDIDVHVIKIRRSGGVGDLPDHLQCALTIFAGVMTLLLHKWSFQAALSFTGIDGLFSHEVFIREHRVLLRSSRMDAGIGFNRQKNSRVY